MQIKSKVYNDLMDALNTIDEQAEQMGGSLEECQERQKAYDLLADFIEGHTVTPRRETILCAHFQCREKKIKDSDSCKGHQYCTCKKKEGQHYIMDHNK